MLWSFAYLAVRNLFALVCLLGRQRRSEDLEILVLRHELAILRRQAARPKSFSDERRLADRVSKALLFGHPLLRDEYWREETDTADPADAGKERSLLIIGAGITGQRNVTR